MNEESITIQGEDGFFDLFMRCQGALQWSHKGALITWSQTLSLTHYMYSYSTLFQRSQFFRIFGHSKPNKEASQFFVLVCQDYTVQVTFSPSINCRLLNILSASIFKVLQSRSKLVKMLSECQTALIWVRQLVTHRLNWIQAVFAYGTIVVLGRLRVKRIWVWIK